MSSGTWRRTGRSRIIATVDSVASRVVMNWIIKEEVRLRYGGQTARDARLSLAFGGMPALYDIEVESSGLGKRSSLWKNIHL